MNELYHINILRAKYDEIRSRNPKFSHRAYSRSLSLDPSTLSKVLNGQRNIPAASLSEILKKLNLHITEEKKFLQSVSQSHKKTGNKARLKTIRPILLEEKKYSEVIGNWEYFAILNLIELDNFVPTYEHIAKRLGLDELAAEKMIKLLIELNLITYCNQKKWKRTNRSLTTTNNKKSEILKKAHKQELELATKALYQGQLNQTGFYSITAQTNDKTIQAIKIKCFNFLKNILKELENGPKEEVYQVGIQLFPLTKQDNAHD